MVNLSNLRSRSKSTARPPSPNSMNVVTIAQPSLRTGTRPVVEISSSSAVVRVDRPETRRDTRSRTKAATATSSPKPSSSVEVVIWVHGGREEDYDSFHLFPNLPVELRLKIWIFAVHATLVPRCIELLYVPRSWREDHLLDVVCFTAPTMRHAPMSVLQVCRASRTEALKLYSLVFDEDNGLGAYNGSEELGPYINWEIDTLCFSPPAHCFWTTRRKRDPTDFNMDMFRQILASKMLSSVAIRIIDSEMQLETSILAPMDGMDLLPMDSTALKELILYTNDPGNYYYKVEDYAYAAMATGQICKPILKFRDVDREFDVDVKTVQYCDQFKSSFDDEIQDPELFSDKARALHKTLLIRTCRVERA